MTVPQEIADLQARITAAQREHSRAEGARDAAQAAVTHAEKELERDFGVTTVEAAQDLLAKLRAELDTITAALNTQLDQIGSP